MNLYINKEEVYYFNFESHGYYFKRLPYNNYGKNHIGFNEEYKNEPFTNSNLDWEAGDLEINPNNIPHIYYEKPYDNYIGGYHGSVFEVIKNDFQFLIGALRPYDRLIIFTKDNLCESNKTLLVNKLIESKFLEALKECCDFYKDKELQERRFKRMSEEERQHILRQKIQDSI